MDVFLNLPHCERRVGSARLECSSSEGLQISPFQRLPIFVPYQNLADEHPFLVLPPMASGIWLPLGPRHGDRRKWPSLRKRGEEAVHRLFGPVEVERERLASEGEGREEKERQRSRTGGRLGDLDGGGDEPNSFVSLHCGGEIGQRQEAKT